MLPLKRLFQLHNTPKEYQRNFLHLYLDIGWFAILSGSTMAFLSVYAVRLGANPSQIGLLGALPAIINLFITIPAGQWLQNRSIGKAVFWTSLFQRFGYLLMVPLPWFFSNPEQVWVLILLAFFMAIPGTALAVGFNAMFAESVPSDWRARVAGTRNVILSVVYVLTSIICGYILKRFPFPTGYQLVFGIGFIGAIMSSVHLFFVRSLTYPQLHNSYQISRVQTENPGKKSRIFNPFSSNALRLDIWKTPFFHILLVLLFFHITQYLVIPLFPIFSVNYLHLNDQQIGIGTAVFYSTVLIGSSQLSKISNRLGHHKVTGLGAIFLSLYPIFLSFSSTYPHFLLTSFLGGISWSLVGGALANYLLEKIPGNDRPAHLAWYNLILNAAILTGSLLGPLVSDWLGLPIALLVLGILRLIAGISILRWG